MRILFITNYYPPYEVGGYEQLCRDVVDRMGQRGHTVSVLTSDHGSEDGSEPTEDAVLRILKLQVSYDRSLGPAAMFFLERRSLIQENLKRLEAVLDEFLPEIVFIWNLQRIPREVASACEERSDLVVAYWLAGYTPAEPDEYWRYWENIPANRLMRFLKRPLRRTAQRVMINEGKPVRPRMKNVAVVSHYMLQKGLLEGTLPANAQVIYNGVEIEKFRGPVKPRENEVLRILQAGRVSPDKGVHTSLKAANYLRKAERSMQFELVIAGSGPAGYIEELEAYVDENALQSHVSFLGWLPREEMPALMAKHEVLLLPTEHPEPFARVMLEGMTGGLAVVASRTGGTGELLKHQVNGLIFEAGDYLDLASQLQLLIEDDGTRQRLAKSGQRKVMTDFTMEGMVDSLEKFLWEALGQGPLSNRER